MLNYRKMGEPNCILHSHVNDLFCKTCQKFVCHRCVLFGACNTHEYEDVMTHLEHNLISKLQVDKEYCKNNIESIFDKFIKKLKTDRDNFIKQCSDIIDHAIENIHNPKVLKFSVSVTDGYTVHQKFSAIPVIFSTKTDFPQHSDATFASLFSRLPG